MEGWHQQRAWVADWISRTLHQSGEGPKATRSLDGFLCSGRFSSFALLLAIFLIMAFLTAAVSLAAPAPTVDISADRRISWQPGIPGGIPTYPAGVKITDYGANGNDQADDTTAIRNAIAAAQPNTAVLFPAGTYYISGTITINKSNIALRGEGFLKTKLMFSALSGRLFEFNSSQGYSSSSGWVSVTGGFTKGSSSVTVASASTFRAGAYAVIRQNNDTDLFKCGDLGCASWQDRAMGQVLKIKQVSGSTVTFEHPLSMTYRSAMSPQLRANSMIENTGIENLSIELRASAGSVNNFDFHDTAFCWLKNVKSQMTYSAHVWLETSLGAEIRGCWFNDSFAHAGGQGYGISAERQATDSLIEDNLFNHLRHSMIPSLGANGNVFGYNFSRNPYDSESSNWLSDDMADHGGYPYQNLFEGNTVQHAAADNNWGTNGPTTFFRNRIEKDLANIDAVIRWSPEQFSYITISANNPYHNIIGNELGIKGSYATTPISLDSSISSTILESCNYSYQSSTYWGKTDCGMAASLYLSSKPSFLGDLPWPPLGGDISPNTNIIPAQKRWNDQTYIPSDTATSITSISMVQTSSITSNGAAITWTTNNSADGQVEYGKTTSYGMLTTLNSALVTAHAQALSGLSSNTTYHYRVKSKDASGNTAISGDYTFTTLIPAAPENLRPQ